jgi:hypothetical protein
MKSRREVDMPGSFARALRTRRDRRRNLQVARGVKHRGMAGNRHARG